MAYAPEAVFPETVGCSANADIFRAKARKSHAFNLFWPFVADLSLKAGEPTGRRNRGVFSKLGDRLIGRGRPDRIVPALFPGLRLTVLHRD